MPSAEGETLSSFQGGKTDYNVTFETSGIDATPMFTMENQVPIIDAQMQISTADKGDGNYPLSPKVDVGIDGDTEWAFVGPGYGYFGNQNKFADNTTSATSEFTSAGGSKTTGNILMPKDATVTSATMDVRGRFVPTSITKKDVNPETVLYVWKSDSGNIDNTGGPDTVFGTYSSMGKVVWGKCPTPATNYWTFNGIDSGLYYPDVRIGDIADTTGGQDIVACHRYYSTGAVYWYCNNNNNGNSWTRYTVATGMMYPAYLRIADMDNDGDNDIVVGCYGYYTYYSSSQPMILWLENDGTPKTGTWTKHSIYYPKTYNDGYSYSMEVGNFDGDAYPDVAWGYLYGIRWAENPEPSSPTFWNYYAVNSSSQLFYYPWGLAAADVDGDGYDDIGAISSSSSYGVAWFENPSSTSTWTKRVLHSSIYGYDIIARQLDGSNGPDFAVVRYYSSAQLYAYIAPATPTTSAWTTRTVGSALYYPRTITGADFDLDSDQDLLAGCYYGEMNWYSNSGTAASWTEHNMVPATAIMDPVGVQTGDFDGDLDDDLVVCGRGSGSLEWYENDGSGTFTSHPVDASASGAVNCEVVDLDFDGDDDIVATHQYAYDVVWYQNNGAGVFTKRNIDTNLMYAFGVSVGDIDKDGHLDVAVTSGYYSGGGVYWYESSDNPTGAWTKHTVKSGLNYAYNCDLGDADGDGDLDIGVTVYYPGAVNWYECPVNPASAGPWAEHQIATGLQYGYDFEWCDIDHDSDLDAVYTQQYYHCKWMENTGTPKTQGSWVEHIIANMQTTYKYPHGMCVADIGQDGYWDVIFTGYWGYGVYWYESPDDPKDPWIAHTVDTTIYYSEEVCVGDYDGDGIEDIAATGSYSEEVKWFKIQTQYCKDPKVDIGADTVNEWQISGDCKGDYSFDFTTAINSLLASAGSPTTDAYGNEMVSIPVKMTVGASAGKITLFDIDMEYTYTATVDVNPHNGDLATEIEEFLAVDTSGADELEIHVALGAASPGKVRLHDLVLNYNAHPVLEEDIPTLKIKEDSTNPNLLDLSDHFSDDFDSPEDLTYSLQISSEDAKHVTLTIQGTMLSISTVIPNWNGQAKATVTATDNGDGASSPSTSTLSNQFTIVVDPVNDEPYVGDAVIPNVKMNEGESITWVDLDKYSYFKDIEGDELYYKVEVDPDGAYADEDLSAWVTADHYIRITANGDFTGTNIPLRVVCDDDPTFGEAGEVNPSQDFKVTVENLPDDKPYWDPIEPVYIPEDSELTQVLSLMEYLHDPDTPIDQLEVYLVGNTNSSWLPASIDEDGNLFVASAQPDYDGSTMLTVKAWDGYNYGLTEVWIYIIPENDLPTVMINTPGEGTLVDPDAVHTIIGSAKDPESLQLVEVGIAQKGQPAGTWTEAKGLTSWKFDWNTEGLEGDSEWTIYARSYDGEEYSDYAFVNVKIVKQSAATLDTDGDGVPDKFDPFPENPYEWEDSDGDGKGDNQEDAFPENKKEWQDSDRDGIGDNSDDTPYGVKGEDSGTGSYTADKEGGLSFNLWWLVALMFIIEVGFLVFLMVKKVRSRKPVGKTKKIQKKKAQ